MSSRWSYATPPALVVAPGPGMPHAGYRRGRLGRAGVLGLAGLAAWMLAGRTILAAGAPRPTFFLVGWDVILDMLELRGHALDAFRLTLGGLWVALPLWLVTGGFRHGPWWRPLANLSVGLAGLAAAIPLLAVVAVLAVNLVLWSIAVMLGLLLLMAMLLRFLTAPLRRW
jgi:hypothetical protein